MVHTRTSSRAAMGFAGLPRGGRAGHSETAPAIVTRLVTLLALPLFTLILAMPAMAQVEVDRESILRELEKTDQIIERAREFAAQVGV